ncbi:hypothetical protein SAMN03080602_01467 [Arenibacter troitsensis]|uniref:NlpE N-terminal domain-containing protein n=2 Tax=Arenibacter troitsensis TaxID=188872 RepID=A0A1X7J8J5_9FLAO|nr:hypothetical protein SAMN03080602_01467 [Arenibacter troitsensis]
MRGVLLTTIFLCYNAFYTLNMKKILTALLLVSSLTSFSQSEIIIGQYFLKLGNEKHQIEYRLNLKADGTFEFHSYINNQNGIPPIVHKYGKGTWILDDKVVSFLTNKEKDLNEKYTLDFSGSKARFVTKPLRDKTDRVVRTRLKFFESKIFWIEGLDIFKT